MPRSLADLPEENRALVNGKYMWQRLMNSASRQAPGHIRQTPRMCLRSECAESVAKKYLTANVKLSVHLSVHEFGTILTSDTLTFQSVSMKPTPVKG